MGSLVFWFFSITCLRPCLPNYGDSYLNPVPLSGQTPTRQAFVKLF